MKNKAIFSFIAFVVLLLLGIIFVNSYVQAISKQEEAQLRKEILNQQMQNDNTTREEADRIYKNTEERMTNYDNNCIQNENCPIYQQNNNYTRHHHNQCSKNNFRKNCLESMCNR